MPKNYKKYFLYTLPMAMLAFWIASIHTTPAIQAYEGIETFYVRYDIKSSKNKIADSSLLMIPGKNEFRAEKFSQIIVSGVISADSKLNQISVEKMVREDSLKSILVKNGLQSVKTKDFDTVISYEGVIITPVKILKTVYNEKQNNYSYEVQVEFSPIAFPDKWETLNMKYRLKKILHNFLELFGI